jgi:hypothetical protein
VIAGKLPEGVFLMEDVEHTDKDLLISTINPKLKPALYSWMEKYTSTSVNPRPENFWHLTENGPFSGFFSDTKIWTFPETLFRKIPELINLIRGFRWLFCDVNHDIFKRQNIEGGISQTKKGQVRCRY